MADLDLRWKRGFWETPRNIAILLGVAATIAAVVGYQAERRIRLRSRAKCACRIRPIGSRTAFPHRQSRKPHQLILAGVRPRAGPEPTGGSR